MVCANNENRFNNENSQSMVHVGDHTAGKLPSTKNWGWHVEEALLSRVRDTQHLTWLHDNLMYWYLK